MYINIMLGWSCAESDRLHFAPSSDHDWSWDSQVESLLLRTNIAHLAGTTESVSESECRTKLSWMINSLPGKWNAMQKLLSQHLTLSQSNTWINEKLSQHSSQLSSLHCLRNILNIIFQSWGHHFASSERCVDMKFYWLKVYWSWHLVLHFMFSNI